MQKKVNKLSDSQMGFIDQNWRTMTHIQMAEAIGSKECTVTYYCTKNEYRKAPTPKNDSRLLLPAEKQKPSNVFVKVKCLSDDQMFYIMNNHQDKTAQKMADHLRVEEYKVSLFCQANAITPKTRWKYKRKDDYHLPIRKRSPGHQRQVPPPEVPIVRAPAVYSNRSYTETIAHYENLKIA